MRIVSVMLGGVSAKITGTLCSSGSNELSFCQQLLYLLTYFVKSCFYGYELLVNTSLYVFYYINTILFSDTILNVNIEKDLIIKN